MWRYPLTIQHDIKQTKGEENEDKERKMSHLKYPTQFDARTLASMKSLDIAFLAPLVQKEDVGKHAGETSKEEIDLDKN